MKPTVRIAFIAAVILIFTSVAFPAISDAAAYSNYEKALNLKILGLLANSPENFELGRVPSRAEGAVMLVRMLGRESLAKQGKYKHPFSDVPAWADCYVGYLYQNGVAMGIGDSRFGAGDPMSAQQYLTLVLRSLGYDDKSDFQYANALEMAKKIGLLTASDTASLKKASSFVRNDLVGISYNALNTRLKGSSRTLLDKLVNEDKAVYKPAARRLGLYTSDLKAELGGIENFSPKADKHGFIARNSTDLFLLLRDTLYHTKNSVNIDIRSYSGSISEEFSGCLDKAVLAVTELTGVEDYLKSWKYVSNGSTFTLTVQYRRSRQEFEAGMAHSKAAMNKARYTVASLIKAGMPEYDKELVLHNYIVNNTKYDYENYLKGKIPDESFSEYGCLVKGVAVCEGYSKAMKLLCDLSALDCQVVSGKSKNGNIWEGHSWNIVKVDGSYYHLDTTNDDPVSKSGDILAYYYFNLPDSEMSQVSRWDRTKYPACTDIKSSYYYRNSMVAENMALFEKAVQTAINMRKAVIELKVGDYTEARYSNLSDLIFGTNSVLRYNSIVNEELGIIRIYNIRYS